MKLIIRDGKQICGGHQSVSHQFSIILKQTTAELWLNADVWMLPCVMPLTRSSQHSGQSNQDSVQVASWACKPDPEKGFERRGSSNGPLTVLQAFFKLQPTILNSGDQSRWASINIFHYSVIDSIFDAHHML